MRRILRLKDFRNFIGESGDVVLELNKSVAKENCGDLVILIGPNNSGKSNVLKALQKVGSKNALTSDDVCDFDENKISPSVSLEISGGKAKIGVTSSLSSFRFYFKKEPENIDLNKIRAELSAFVQTNDLSYFSPIKEAIDKNPDLSVQEVLETLEEFGKKELSYPHRHFFVRQSVCNYIENYRPEFKEFFLYKYFLEQTNAEVAAENFLSENNLIKALPKVVVYKEKEINNSDLMCERSGLKNSSFFKALLQSISFPQDKILTAYEKADKLRSTGYLSNLEREINKRLKAISDMFNRLYSTGGEKYTFELRVFPNQVSLEIYRGQNNNVVLLEKQSTGFRWFFDLFFSETISPQNLNPGDIVIMDEPATNLHPNGQRELRAFLKEFCQRTGITVVMATHSPFLIDPDEYDELRVISVNDGKASIHNDFAAIASDDPDTLAPIKEALTIKQNVLYDPDVTVIWVEGITDYCYLTMFKRLLSKKDVAFLPFNGVGKTDADRKRILSKLQSIRFFSRNILCDGDKAGNAMIKICKDSDFPNPLSLGELFPAINGNKSVEIEDIFSKSDRDKYPVLQSENPLFKRFWLASFVKQTAKKEDFDEETLKNFDALLERCIDN